jgi:hypothetical protein
VSLCLECSPWVDAALSRQGGQVVLMLAFSGVEDHGQHGVGQHSLGARSSWAARVVVVTTFALLCAMGRPFARVGGGGHGRGCPSHLGVAMVVVGVVAVAAAVLWRRWQFRRCSPWFVFKGGPFCGRRRI